MNTNFDIETLLLSAPKPLPPVGLLDQLEEQIILRQQPHTWRSPKWISKIRNHSEFGWLRTLSWGSTITIIVAALIFLFGTGKRSIADSAEKLSKVSSVRMVSYYRSGPAVHVWRDRSKSMNEFPNYSTTMHPDNPLITEETLFRKKQNNSSLSEMVIRRDNETVWISQNRQLRIITDTGERVFRLNSKVPSIGDMASPIRTFRSASFKELNLSDVSSAPELMHCWIGEHRINNNQLPGFAVRVWLEEDTEHARRVEIISEDHSDVSPPWIQQAYEFHDFNTSFNDEAFEFEITESDAAQLNLTLEELEVLSSRAFSIELNGEEGAAFQGTISDESGSIDISGTLPAMLVSDPKGVASLDIRMADGQARRFGIAVNDARMQTTTARIVGTIGLDGSANVSSKNN